MSTDCNEEPRSHYEALLLKGTKYQLPVYGKMPIVNGFYKACVTFHFSFCSIRDGRFEI